MWECDSLRQPLGAVKRMGGARQRTGRVTVAWMRTGISVAEARALVLAEAQPLAAETVPAESALGRVLAQTVRAPRTLPPADCSAMDGYALRAADLARASAAAPVELAVVYEVAAGGRGDVPLKAGEAARIFTGAPLPPGADTVVRQEQAQAQAARVRIAIHPKRGDSVRRAGEELRAGEVALEPGVKLSAAALGLLASLGRTQVAVHRRPRVALLSSGDELVEPDAAITDGRIVASNAYALAAQCSDCGAESFNLGIARDTPAELEALLRAGLSADLLISSAGVSVGDHDHVRPVLEKLGCRLRFWGVNMKPGYPLAFGRFEPPPGPLVFALPGNPVSALVCFEQFVRPVLLRLAGRHTTERPLLRVTLSETLRKVAGRMHFVRVRLRREAGRVFATPTCNQSSGVQRSMVLAQGLLVFDAEATELAAGSEAQVQLLDLDFLSGACW